MITAYTTHVVPAVFCAAMLTGLINTRAKIAQHVPDSSIDILFDSRFAWCGGTIIQIAIVLSSHAEFRWQLMTTTFALEGFRFLNFSVES
jgi:hypothetical protein